MSKHSSNKTVLVIGSGGREAALVYGYSKSSHVSQILAVPGNDLMSDVTEKPVKIFPRVATTDIGKILEICIEHHVDLVDIAQDNAVAAGLGDALEKAAILFTGPKRAAGQLEWDKAWSRQFMEQTGIPHPSFGIFSSLSEAHSFLDEHPDKPWVVKAGGLAEGKGVFVTGSRAEAKEAVNKMAEFHTAGETFLIEACLQGEEFSTFVVSDGVNWQIIGSAQDHKRALDGDKGLNTGGMGCSTPPLIVTPELTHQISSQILAKTVQSMREVGRPYTGILYLGGMVLQSSGTNHFGSVSVIEFNARWGDPEAQVLIPSLKTDLFELSQAVAMGDISQMKIQTDQKARVVIAGTASGYPDAILVKAVRGKQIFGLSAARQVAGVQVFGAGVKRVKGKDYANGGRLFYIVGEGKDVIQARKRAYEAMSLVSVEGNNLHFRTDIGWRDVKRLENE